MKEIKMGIRLRLNIGNIVICVILFMIGAVGVSNVQKVGNYFYRLYHQDSLPLIQLYSIVGLADEMRAGAFVLVNENDGGKIDQARQLIDNSYIEINKKINAFTNSDFFNNNNEQDSEAFKKFSNQFANYKNYIDRIVDLVLNRRKADAQKILLNEGIIYFNSSVNNLNNFIRVKNLDMEKDSANVGSIKNSTIIFLIVLTLLGMALAILMGAYNTRSIFSSFNKLNDIVKDIAEGEGDLTKRINIHSGDEIGLLSNNFDHFISKLNDDILQVEKASASLKLSSDESKSIVEEKIQNNVDGIKKSINQINSQTENATSGIEELTATLEEMARNIDSIMNNMVKQAAAVEEGASSIEEMVRNIENTASLSKKTSEISVNLNNVSIEGGSAVKTSIKSIKEVAEYSQQILKLLGLITNIAKQTNLLAMNAAIEAAHAGEAGKGFAIVADEIRRLSEDTNKNARDISDVVATIVSKIDDSVKIADKAGIGLDMITAYSQQNAQIINQLSVAMSEQNNGATEILQSTQEIVKITEEVKFSITEQKNATDEFSHAIRELRDLSIDNQEVIKLHTKNVGELMEALESVKRIIIANQEQAQILHNVVDRFVLKNAEDSPTSLKLVE
jgi:methyl-accepting chemotaxis protein